MVRGALLYCECRGEFIIITGSETTYTQIACEAKYFFHFIHFHSDWKWKFLQWNTNQHQDLKSNLKACVDTAPCMNLLEMSKRQQTVSHFVSCPRTLYLVRVWTLDTTNILIDVRPTDTQTPLPSIDDYRMPAGENNAMRTMQALCECQLHSIPLSVDRFVPEKTSTKQWWWNSRHQQNPSIYPFEIWMQRWRIRFAWQRSQSHWLQSGLRRKLLQP